MGFAGNSDGIFKCEQAFVSEYTPVLKHIRLVITEDT